MKKKDYINPSVDIIELNRQAPLLAGSVLNAEQLVNEEMDDAWAPKME